MTRQEKINKAQSLEREIREIKEFMRVLEYENTISKQNKFSSAMIEITVKKSFLGLWTNSEKVEIQIPDKMTIEIAAKCKIWVDELEREANKLVVGN
jgi:hypothetical protein